MTLTELTATIGQEVGVSDWFELDQSRIDAFADITEDRQFILVDPDLARQTPLGGTLAHGLLVTSLQDRGCAGGSS